MLFTTSTFAFLFLPIVLIGYYGIGRRSMDAAAAWLFAASVFFYGYWMPEFTLLLLVSIAVNFCIGAAIQAARRDQRMARGKTWLVAGLVFNLGLLAYFKYANFFVENLAALFGAHWGALGIILPIGISFYSFTQIAFLVDTWQGKVHEVRPIHYGLFVTFFPHLIAGPVLHHAQMMPQFSQPSSYRFDAAKFFGGCAIFALGLFKKIVLADGIAPFADAVFNGADAGMVPRGAEAWLGALAYTLQLYFDFSGYSDMAIGLSWMFNIRLPFNFDSPYKSASISEFWRRWHISLSTFLRDYLYVPLGGNRKGPVRRYLNLAATMVLGGLWHGASWSFVLWGSLHGLYLMVNHGWRALQGRLGLAMPRPLAGLGVVLGWALTMLAVVLAWVFFRAVSLDGAWRMLGAMAGTRAGAPEAVLLWNAGLQPLVGWLWCAMLAALAVLAPNSNRLGDAVHARFAASAGWREIGGTVAVCLAVFLVVVNSARQAVSAFIYFNF
ncbi:MAG: MBOAT family protein [Roseateles sp.]|uniref:MBOAT family O-acyltransferase n=1 Tax=Roseateles sp. TaxID=1971397 RepID=UPI0039E86A0C